MYRSWSWDIKILNNEIILLKVVLSQIFLTMKYWHLSLPPLFFIICLLFITECYIWICCFEIVCNINANWFLTWYHKFHTRKCVSCSETGEMLKSQKWLQWRYGIVKPVNISRGRNCHLRLHDRCFKIIISLLKWKEKLLK